MRFLPKILIFVFIAFFTPVFFVNAQSYIELENCPNVSGSGDTATCVLELSNCGNQDTGTSIPCVAPPAGGGSTTPAVKLKNPLSQDWEFLRTELLAS
ncbi:MAG: hypothetical protein US50_C0008G0013, partial [Candidatus Nomurabacteria bacterium GW2011_GWB1_37_5]